MTLFYSNNINTTHLYLENQEMIHCKKSLRKKNGDLVNVLDGKGSLYNCKIINIEKCKLEIIDKKKFKNKNKVHLLIAPTKNHKRIEWMLEKIVEIGLYRISFIICNNSIRKEVNLKRLNKIALSAMKQTKNYFLPIIDNCINYQESFQLIKSKEKYIAHLCYNGLPNLNSIKDSKGTKCILIGPEGDFSENEIKYALDMKFIEISLGNSRLRTETAGIVSTTILNL